MADSYDVIVIGSGAGGGTLVHRLAPTGKKILLLERGGYVPREKDNWEPRAVNLEGKYQTKEVWKDRNGDDLHPLTNYAVGGIPSRWSPRRMPSTCCRCSPRAPAPSWSACKPSVR